MSGYLYILGDEMSASILLNLYSLPKGLNDLRRMLTVSIAFLFLPLQ